MRRYFIVGSRIYELLRLTCFRFLPTKLADIGSLKAERPVSFHGLLMCRREFAARRAKMDAILRKNHMADAAARAAPKSSNR